MTLNSFQTTDQFKLKTFAYNKIIVTENIEICFVKQEKNVIKGQNAAYQHFFFFYHNAFNNQDH